MSNIIEELRKRNMKVREIYNKYKLGMHPFLVDPDAPKIHRPKDDRDSPERVAVGSDDFRSANTGSPNGSDSKELSKISGSKDEETKTDLSWNGKYIDYNDVLED